LGRGEKFVELSHEEKCIELRRGEKFVELSHDEQFL
jgi:hypothetical protein